MFVILTYDINERRVNKILKICRRYLNHIQNSVFEGEIGEKGLHSLKKEIYSVINESEDSIVLYKLQNTKFTHKETIGMNKENTSNIV
ncbi:MAG: CRISPR-associated endonuclease Cas2 [Candidatus Aenigmarchaeota archaeon]|nr:CRISPR-associated endonuclease Cas2 [Candidatus Aenigmarchaeota archaeon]